MNRPDESPLRCELCRFKPLLATFGRDASGELYIHVKVYKSGRVYGNIYATGSVRLQCRDCLRWHNVRIVQPDKAVLVPEESAFPLDNEPAYQVRS